MDNDIIISLDEPCCYPFLGFHTKMRKYNTYIYIYVRNSKIIGVGKRRWNAHKMARNWLRSIKNTRINCKKIDFLSQFRFLLEEIKVLGSNYNFEELI